VKNKVTNRGVLVPGKKECSLGKWKASPGRRQWSVLEKRAHPNFMQVPQQLLYFLVYEADTSTGKFQSCCLSIQASGNEEEKADASSLVNEGSAL